MFDTSVATKMQINAVTGTICKSYKDSFMYRFHIKSRVADNIFSLDPKLGNKEVVVLQVMQCGNQELIAELIWKSDFDKLFEVDESN